MILQLFTIIRYIIVYACMLFIKSLSRSKCFTEKEQLLTHEEVQATDIQAYKVFKKHHQKGQAFSFTGYSAANLPIGFQCIYEQVWQMDGSCSCPSNTEEFASSVGDH